MKPIAIPVVLAIRDSDTSGNEEFLKLADQDFNLAVCMLASGSKGNAIYISDGYTAILIDAGLSGTEIEHRLRQKNLCPENLDGIVVSHEHTDHARGVGVLARRFGLPVYVSRKTHEAAASQIGSVKDLINFRCGTTFPVKTLSIHPFSISHDAEDPAGFTVQQNGMKIGIATDLGIPTSMVKEHLKDCTLMILEANHDPTMLIEGPYPWYLKQRIKGRSGHLSNKDSRTLLEEVRHDRLLHVILAHLSETNNTPEAALKEVEQAIKTRHTRISVATQSTCGDIILI